MKNRILNIARLLALMVCFLPMGCSSAQAPENRPKLEKRYFDRALVKMLDFSVPLVGVAEVKAAKDVVLLDAREKAEFETSHIQGARHVGYDDFDTTNIKDIPKDKKIIVYCSVGYRSEKIGEKLQAAGYTNVHNFYGSIFEWANKGEPLVTPKGESTKKLHTYSFIWSRFVSNTDIKKIW